MTHDLVIRGGTIVDGTGRAGFSGDLAIDGDRITAIGEVSGPARRTIDADGALVTARFVAPPGLSYASLVLTDAAGNLASTMLMEQPKALNLDVQALVR